MSPSAHAPLCGAAPTAWRLLATWFTVCAAAFTVLVVTPQASAAKQVAVAPAHACALLDNGTVRCWGYTDNGRWGASGPPR